MYIRNNIQFQASGEAQAGSILQRVSGRTPQLMASKDNI